MIHLILKILGVLTLILVTTLVLKFITLRCSTYLSKKFKAKAEMDICAMAVQKKRLSFVHKSVVEGICFHAICFFFWTTLYFFIVLIDDEHGAFPYILVLVLSIDALKLIVRIFQKMRYRQVKTSDSFADVESRVDQWVETLITEPGRSVSWKTLRNAESDPYKDLSIGIDTDKKKENPFIIHIVKNDQGFLFNLVGMDKEYNHGLCKDYESIEFGFPKIMRTDYTTHYDQHSDCLDKLEAVLKGNGETVVEK